MYFSPSVTDSFDLTSTAAGIASAERGRVVDGLKHQLDVELQTRLAVLTLSTKSSLTRRLVVDEIPVLVCALVTSSS